MVVSPQQPSSHPEWKDLFDSMNSTNNPNLQGQGIQGVGGVGGGAGSQQQQNFLHMRHLGRRIGYFINDIYITHSTNSKEKECLLLEKIYRKDRKNTQNSNHNKNAYSLKGGSGGVEALFGMHLYRCWFCKRTLLKPLQCASCQRVVYCGRECQKKDWIHHKSMCLVYQEHNQQQGSIKNNNTNKTK